MPKLVRPVPKQDKTELVKGDSAVKKKKETAAAETEEENDKENVGEVAKVAEEVPTKPDTVKTVQADQIGRYWLSLIL